MNHTTQRAIIISMLAAFAIGFISIVGTVPVQAQPVTGGLNLGASSVNLSPQGIQIAVPGLSLSLTNSTGGPTTAPVG